MLENAGAGPHVVHPAELPRHQWRGQNLNIQISVSALNQLWTHIREGRLSDLETQAVEDSI